MEKLKGKLEKLENTASVSAIKSGLIAIIPVLIMGSAALVFEYFPIVQYQAFIETAFSGKLFLFFDLIYDATFGMLSVYLTCAVSFAYAKRFRSLAASIAAPLTSLICFLICSGFRVTDFPLGALGVKGVFVAIVSALLATRLLGRAMMYRAKRTHGYAEDSDVEFNYSVSVILPAAAVVSLFALVNVIIISIFDVDSAFTLVVNAVNALFLPMGRSFLSAMLLVLTSSLLWFFGIHGSNVLEAVMENLFTPAIDINIALAEAGQAPTEIFTKQFFDVFVLMGGCGTAICLLLSVLIFSKRRRNGRISKLAAIPMLFNINELMIFGYPVIYNPTLLLPFILTPLFSFVTTYAAMRSGLVPLITANVNWTAPVLLSGYTATGSLSGSALQLFNIAAGIFIYRPFVLANDRKREAADRALVGELTDIKKDSETTLIPVTLTRLTDAHGVLAHSMAADLKYAMEQRALALFYQPQYDQHGECVGVEALLRWKHPLYGMVYPPLVIQLARESGILVDLEKYILLYAVEDAERIKRETGYDREISVNISAATLQTDEYMALLEELAGSGAVKNDRICLEITEQTAMVPNEDTAKHFQAIKDMGYRLAIDDFSMGHTSLAYLQESRFDTVKLDGSLVTEMLNNPRSYDIIRTITDLAHKLGFSVIAEYVETEEQVKMLQTADCFQYQGYLFSKAVDCNSLIKRLQEDKKRGAK